MKLRNLFACAVASAMALVACQPEETDLGTPSIALSASEVTLSAEGGDTTLTVTATRDWTVTLDEATAEWLVVDPAAGTASADPQTVTVYALANDGYSREASVAFTIGMQTKYLTVKQDGAKGSAESLVIYSNDFDKTKAEKGNQWSTYLDTFDGWLNATGVGAANVSYGFEKMTARTNSSNGSAGNHSLYTGSGMNYLWFGSGTPYFTVKNITLTEGVVDYTLSFGTERYEYEASDNTFKWEEFKVYVSVDGKKWVKPTFNWATGSVPNGKWDLASTTFAVPAGTTSLNVYFVSSVGSAYAIDDLRLVQSLTTGTALDFSAGEDFEVGTNTVPDGGANDDNGGSNNDGSNNNGEATPPADAYFVESFADGIGNFAIDNKSLPAELEYVWKHEEYNGKKYMKATAYKNAPFASESWLVSPEVDLTNATSAYLSFNHTGKFFADAATETTLWVSKDGAGWTQLNIPNYTTDWVWVFSGNINLKDFIGGKMKFAFKYLSSSSNAPTWEVKNICISSTELVPSSGDSNDNSGDTGSGDSNGGGVDSNAGWSYKFASGDFGSEYSAPVTKTFNGVAWNFTMQESAYLGFDNSNGRGLQMGKKADPASEITLSTVAIAGNIKKIVVNSAGASGTDAKLTVSIGAKVIGPEVSVTTSPKDYTFEATEAVSGEIVLKWTLSAAAVYINTISVYTE